MQNKANFLNAQMNVTTVITKDYEKNPLQPPRKTKPIGEKAEINLLVHVGRRQTSTKGECAHKTTPFMQNKANFQRAANECNLSSNKHLRRKITLGGPKKQSQSKPNLKPAD